jgi:hypothetical protein
MAFLRNIFHVDKFSANYVLIILEVRVKMHVGHYVTCPLDYCCLIQFKIDMDGQISVELTNIR